MLKVGIARFAALEKRLDVQVPHVNVVLEVDSVRFLCSSLDSST